MLDTARTMLSDPMTNITLPLPNAGDSENETPAGPLYDHSITPNPVLSPYTFPSVQAMITVLPSPVRHGVATIAFCA